MEELEDEDGERNGQNDGWAGQFATRYTGPGRERNRAGSETRAQRLNSSRPGTAVENNA